MMPTVLAVMIAGLALCGAAFYIYDGYSRSSMRQTQQTEEYTILEEGLELGKLRVAEMMKTAPSGTAIKGHYKYAGHSVKSPEDLLLGSAGNPSSSDIIEIDDVNLESRAEKLSMRVYIFDTSYTDGDIDPSITEDARRALPPMSGVTDLLGDAGAPPRFEDGEIHPGLDAGEGVGSYLVRATLSRPDNTTKTIELSFTRKRSD